MTHAFEISYLDDAMSNVGSMMDYAVNSCGEDLDLFWTRFLTSGIARSLSRANAKYLAGMSGVELARRVAALTGDSLPQAEPLIDMGSPEYWTGWTMAYIVWYLNIDYEALRLNGLNITDLYLRYPSLHEADISKSVRFARKKLQDFKAQKSPLKRARENAGITQADLAALSGNTLRAIRSYEQGRRSLGSASSQCVRSICRTIGCREDTLLGSGFFDVVADEEV